MPHAVHACGVTRVFRTKKASVDALHPLDLDIPAGGMTALVGPDGAGKTTLIRMISGLLAPSSGTLAVLGLDSVRQAQAIQERISYMPQRFGLYEDLSVRENLDLYADLHGVPRGQRKERFGRLLEMTDLACFTTRPAGKLSGGMKQKLALACSLVRTPDLLLLDEPSVGVDPLSRRELWEIITGMVRDEKITVIVSTASMDEAERCGTICVLHQGRMLLQGQPQELKALAAGRCYVADVPAGISARRFQSCLLDQDSLVMDAVPEGGRVRFVLNAAAGQAKAVLARLSARMGRLPLRYRPSVPTLEDGFMHLLRAGSEQDGIPPCMGNAAHAELPEQAAVRCGDTLRMDVQEAGKDMNPGECVIEVRDLVRKFGSFTAVDKTTFTVRRGEVFGLLGPNGAGKTTTFRMLCGLLPATSGFLRVAGKNLRTAAAQARAKVGYVSQKFSLYGNLSVADNLRFFGGVYGIGPLALRRRMREVIGQFGLEGCEEAISGTLPGGYKQRLAMAVGLLHEPEILFLDEPTSGIDPLARRVFWRQISSLAVQGTTVVITTHFMEEAEYCDRMLIQDAGRVLALGTPSEVRLLAGNAGTMEEAFIRIVEHARAAQKSGKQAA